MSGARCLVLCLAAAALAGCFSEIPTKAGATDADLKSDYGECHALAVENAPPTAQYSNRTDGARRLHRHAGSAALPTSPRVALCAGLVEAVACRVSPSPACGRGRGEGS